jgi:acyl dehydratase
VGYRVPIFLDDAYAKSKGMAGRSCPSHLIMSFSTAMTGDLFQDSIIALMTIENARFLAVVRPGDTIRTEVEVLEKRETSKPDRGIVVFRDHVYNQHGSEVFRNDKTALVRRWSAA